MINRHLEEVLALVGGISRTFATGLVDSSSSVRKQKADLQAGGAVVREAVVAAIDLLDAEVPTAFTRDLLCHVNGVLVEGSYPVAGLRDFPVDANNYLSPSRIHEDLEEFVKRVRAYPQADRESDAQRFIFDVHWSVNLHGHYFHDACSRTATVVGAWVSVCLTGNILPLPSRPDYLAIPYADDPLRAWMDTVG